MRSAIGARAPLTHLPLLASTLALSALTSGCRQNAVESPGTDNSFIRAPGEAPSGPALPPGPLLPLRQGARWSYGTVAGAATTGAGKPGSEEVTVSGPMKIGGANGVALSMRKEGKVYRQEVFQETESGLYLIGAGSDDKMSITPPIPLVGYPVKEGAVQSWSGLLRFKTTAAPGTAHSRVSAREVIQTPAGKFPCYRVDTVISTTVQGRQVAFPTTRWLSPRVGIVKQRILAGEATLTKTLVSYKVP